MNGRTSSYEFHTGIGASHGNVPCRCRGRREKWMIKTESVICRSVESMPKVLCGNRASSFSVETVLDFEWVWVLDVMAHFHSRLQGTGCHLHHQERRAPVGEARRRARTMHWLRLAHFVADAPLPAS